MDPPLTRFVFSSKQAPDGESTLEGRFDANAYKLMEKAGYDFKHPAPLGHVIKPHPYSLNQIRGAAPKNTCLGYKSSPPIKIAASRKGDTSSAHYIAAEEVGEDEDVFNQSPQASSVFDRTRPHAREPRPSVFTRMTMPAKKQSLLSRKRSSVFNRLGVHGANNDTTAPRNRGHQSCKCSKISKNSVFNRLGTPIPGKPLMLQIASMKAKISTPQKTDVKKGTKAHTAAPHPYKPASKAAKDENLKTPDSIKKTHVHS